MRGAAMPNLVFKSWSMMSSTRARPSRLSAAATSFSGKWVVASATRSGGGSGRPAGAGGWPASIITTCAVPVWSAKYSVWPENGTPASLMVLFCSGAVTTALNQPARTPSMAASSVASTLRPFSLSSWPGTTCAASGTSITLTRPGPNCGRPPWRTACSDSADKWMAGSIWLAVMARKAASPSSTQLTSWRRAQAARMAISGPMPAGSPTVTAIAGRSALRPVCKVALTRAPLGGLLVGGGAVFGAELDVGAVAHFAQVDAETGFHRLAHFADLQAVHRRLEFRHDVARIQPAQVAALGGRAVVRHQPRQVLELGGVVVQAFLQFGQLALGVGRAHGRRDLDQDVAGVGLLHGGGGLGLGHAAPLDHLQDVEGAGALDDGRHLARLQLDQRLGEHGRQPLGLAPAHHAALQGVAGVGIGAGHLGEVGAGAQLAHHLLGARLALGDHLGGGVVGDAHHDLRDVELELLGGGGLLGRHEAVDLGVGDLDLRVDLVLAQTLHDDLLADLLAEGGERRAVLLHLVAQVLHRQLLGLGDAADGAVELGVVDAHAHL